MQENIEKTLKMENGIYPILPLRDIVIFPHMIVPLFVGRDKSIYAIEKSMQENKKIFLVTQKNSFDDDPKKEDIYNIGTISNILQLLKLPDGTIKVLVEGVVRASIKEFCENDTYFQAEIEILKEIINNKLEVEALTRSIIADFEIYLKLNKKISSEAINSVNQIQNPSKLADTIASHLTIKFSNKQKILQLLSVDNRLKKVLDYIESEISVLQLEKKIRSRVKKQMEKTQREYYLNEQLKAIQKELGENEDGKDEISKLENEIKNIKFTKEAKEKAFSEIKKLRSMSPMSAEATVVRNYLDWLFGIPWKKKSKINKNLSLAEKILNKEHFGLEKVKERIIEYLAVQTRSEKMKGPILCFVGPPGVGKTSLAKSIAKATGREYVRMSLGGVRDESEIRGHRRTYIGSMPGKIIQSMKKVKKSNPLLLLDEIDKIGQDFRGDPSAALLEVLDTEQNSTFVDHYMEVEYDLSNVMFIMTANILNISRPLLDRMEVIRISGYTEYEKLEIFKLHLLPKIIKVHALKDGEFSIEEKAIKKIIREYTREAGVRNLERCLMKLSRKAVTKIVRLRKKIINITCKNITDYLGIEKFRTNNIDIKNQVGIVTGLAWTEVGGELLTIECVMMPGKGRMIITGNLKDVMKESITAASSYVRSKALVFGIQPIIFEKNDIHVHVPEGATPKDGPSAGVAMITSIVSTMTGIPIRKDIAMTGEITLRGRILAIGGIKEKLLAALRGKIKIVLIPEENERDLSEIPDIIKDGLHIIPVSHVNDILKHALVHEVQPIVWKKSDNNIGSGDPSISRKLIAH